MPALMLRKGMHRAIDSYSTFYENDRTTPTGLVGYLRERGLTRVFLAGLAFDFCVRYSAEDARRQGFDAFVIEDACRGIDLDGSVTATRAQPRGARDPVHCRGGHQCRQRRLSRNCAARIASFAILAAPIRNGAMGFIPANHILRCNVAVCDAQFCLTLPQNGHVIHKTVIHRTCETGLSSCAIRRLLPLRVCPR